MLGFYASVPIASLRLKPDAFSYLVDGFPLSVVYLAEHVNGVDPAEDDTLVSAVLWLAGQILLPLPLSLSAVIHSRRVSGVVCVGVLKRPIFGMAMGIGSLSGGRGQGEGVHEKEWRGEGTLEANFTQLK